MANVPKQVSPEEEVADSPLAIRRLLTVEFGAGCCALFQRVCSRDSGDASPSSLRCDVSFLGDIRHRLQPGCLGRFPMWRPFRPYAVVVREFCRALPTARPSILPDYLHGIGCIRRAAWGLRLVPRWKNRGWAAPACGETDNAKRQDKERTRRQRTEGVVCGGSSCRRLPGVGRRSLLSTEFQLTSPGIERRLAEPFATAVRPHGQPAAGLLSHRLPPKGLLLWISPILPPTHNRSPEVQRSSPTSDHHTRRDAVHETDTANTAGEAGGATCPRIRVGAGRGGDALVGWVAERAWIGSRLLQVGEIGLG